MVISLNRHPVVCLFCEHKQPCPFPLVCLISLSEHHIGSMAHHNCSPTHQKLLPGSSPAVEGGGGTTMVSRRSQFSPWELFQGKCLASHAIQCACWFQPCLLCAWCRGPVWWRVLTFLHDLTNYHCIAKESWLLVSHV